MVHNMELATLLVGGVGELLITYLGLPLGALFKSLMIWDMVEERLLLCGSRNIC